KFDLALELIEAGDTLVARWGYSSDLFDRETIAAMARSYLRLLEAAAAVPDCPVGALELLDDLDRRRLVVERNATAAPVPDRPVHELLEAAAVRAPDAVAVVCGAEIASYRELDARANQLAGMLRELGVRRGQLVGLCIERSVDMVVALLAIWKAGAAYLPLDP